MGCGGSAVDASAIKGFDFIACDFSDWALEVYRDNNPTGVKRVKANPLNLNIKGALFDGIYNPGVVLANFRQALKPKGVLVVFWPPEFRLSVKVLEAARFLLNDILGENIQRHPPETSKIRSQKQIDELLRRHRFMLE